MKLTRLSGNSPVYVTTTSEYRIDIDSVEFDIRNFEDGNKFAPEGYSLQEIMEKLYKEGKAERWDNNEQHKVLRDEEGMRRTNSITKNTSTLSHY